MAQYPQKCFYQKSMLKTIVGGCKTDNGEGVLLSAREHQKGVGDIKKEVH